MNPTSQEELRQRILRVLHSTCDDWLILQNCTACEIQANEIVQLADQHTTQAVAAALEEFRVFCYETHAFEAFDMPDSNRQGWLDTKLRDFAAAKGQQK